MQLLAQLKIRQMSCQINLRKEDSISSSKNWLLRLIPEISPSILFQTCQQQRSFQLGNMRQ